MTHAYYKSQENYLEPPINVNSEYEEIIKQFINSCSDSCPEEFIRKRKYNPKIIAELGIGFCDIDAISRFRSLPGIDVETMKKMGFFISKKFLFRDRVIIPYNNFYFAAKSINPNEKDLYKNLFPKKEIAGNKPFWFIKGKTNILIVVEGEADLIASKHTYINHNILCVGGVQTSLKAIKSIDLEGYEVWLCLDNDKYGNEWTLKCSNYLFDKNVEHKLLSFDANYKDIDELFRHFQNDTINQIELKPSTKETEFDKMQGFSAEWLLNNDIPKTEWLIDNLLVKNGITVIGGDSGVGKSLIALLISLCAVTGKNLFDIFPCKKSSILYLDEENTPSTIKTRLCDITSTSDITDNLDNINFYCMENIKLDSQQGRNKDGLQKFNHLIKKHKPQICIIDSLVRFFAGDENSSNDVKEIFETLKYASKEFGTSFILLHHTTKLFNGGTRKHTLRGSGDISAMADIVLVLNKVANTQYVSIYQEKNRHEQQIQPFNMLINEINGALNLSYGGELCDGKKGTIVDTTTNEIINMIKKNDWVEMSTISAKPIFLKKGFTDRQWYSALKNMQDQGWISKIEGKKGFYKINDKFREVCEYDN